MHDVAPASIIFFNGLDLATFVPHVSVFRRAGRFSVCTSPSAFFPNDISTYLSKWKRVLKRDRWYAVEHLCSWYLFSSKTSEMIPTGTLLFLKIKAGSKKRQILFLVPIFHRNFRDDTHWNTSFFWKWKRVLRRDRWYAVEHLCSWYLFSSKTSKMIPTGTLLFLNYFWKWKGVLRRGNKRQNDILNNNISVFGTYFPAKLPRWYPLEHFYFWNESGF